MTTRTDRLRVLTLNLWHDKPPWERRRDLIVRGLEVLAPDVVALQEVAHDAERLPNQAQTLAGRCGYHWAWAPAFTRRSGAVQGVAILAKAPIGATTEAVLPCDPDEEPRVVIHARVDTGVAPVHCYSTHLSYKLDHGLERERQVLALDDFVRATGGDHLQVLMGDFNATPDHDEIRFLRGMHTIAGRRTRYQDGYGIFERLDRPGPTWSRRNSFAARCVDLPFDRRIDYIFVSKVERDGRGLVHACDVVLDQPDRDGIFASDHFGVLAEIQLTSLALGPAAPDERVALPGSSGSA